MGITKIGKTFIAFCGVLGNKNSYISSLSGYGSTALKVLAKNLVPEDGF